MGSSILEWYLGLFYPTINEDSMSQETLEALLLPDAKSPTSRFSKSGGSFEGTPRLRASVTWAGSYGVSRGPLHGRSCIIHWQAWGRDWKIVKYGQVCVRHIFFIISLKPEVWRTNQNHHRQPQEYQDPSSGTVWFKCLAIWRCRYTPGSWEGSCLPMIKFLKQGS